MHFGGKKVEETEFCFENNNINVTITIGIAKRNTHASVEKWIQKADENLYIGKNKGRNMCVNWYGSIGTVSSNFTCISDSHILKWW